MEKPKSTADLMQEVRVLLDRLVNLQNLQSKRIEDLMTELARVKEAQNEMLAGLALYERGQRLKESLVVGERVSEPEESTWQSVEAYCLNCMKMVPIIEPVSTFQDEHVTVRAKCRICARAVIRTLV